MSALNSLRNSRILDSDGGSLIEMALVLPIFLLLIFGTIDFGRAYYQAIEVDSAAHAGATYGLQNPQDIDGMKNAASVGASNLSNLSTSASYGCECADGSSAVDSCTYTPSCSDNYVTYVDVTTTSKYKPLFNYPGMPKEFNFRGETRLRVGGN